MAKIPARAGILDIVIEQGTTLPINITWKDEAQNLIDLTGYSARLQVRESISSESVLIELTSDDSGGITLGGINGTIQLVFSEGDTAALAVRKAVYDLEIIDTYGAVRRLLQGTMFVNKEVTRP